MSVHSTETTGQWIRDRANKTYPADFIRDNLGIALNVIHEAYGAGVQRLLFLGSTCIYPRREFLYVDNCLDRGGTKRARRWHVG